jgi:hypothetical protein
MRNPASPSWAISRGSIAGPRNSFDILNWNDSPGSEPAPPAIAGRCLLDSRIPLHRLGDAI